MKSILHNKKDGTCYLCMKLHGDYSRKTVLQEHHAIPGTANRHMSEKYGLKVYLDIQHHLEGPEAVHQNEEISILVKQDAQRAFEKTHTRAQWMAAFGKNYL